jgi:Ca2+-binding RTX toxin-like protein/20S proteasome alpha/beta subunit
VTTVIDTQGSTSLVQSGSTGVGDASLDSATAPGDATVDADVGLLSQADTSLIHLDQFRADPRFSGIDGHGVSVVVIDTGIDLDNSFFGPDANHNGVADRIVYSYDFSGSNDSDASDHDGHGSNVASIIGSQDGTYTGMAPGVNIIALKVFPDNAALGATISDIAEALNWVVANRAAYNIVAVNMSLGSGDNLNAPTPSPFASQFATLAANNTAVVVASGNSYASYQTQGVSTPSADPNAWSIGAVWDRNAGSFSWVGGATDFSTGPDRIISFSQRSTTMTTIFAPGGQITGASWNGGLITESGTSQATPHVAGLVADMQQLALQVSGHFLSVSQLKQDMINGSVSIFDGDDENDNVANTLATYHRVDAVGWGTQVLNDLFAGTTGSDTLNGTSVADTIHGNLGNDTLRGNDGNDTLYGDAGGDTLFGNAGNDRLDGGTGNDTLIGGTGSDVFVYAIGYGADTVADFSDADGDTIDFTTISSVSTLSDVLSRATQVGADTIINFGGSDTLTLTNVNESALAASDFYFVTTLESFGSTKLVQVSNNYAFYPVGGSSSPQIRFNGAAMTVGQFGSWVPFAAEQITGGYEIAWKIVGTDQYSVWNTDGNGNMLTNPTGIVSGSSYALESLEASFQQDLNGDGIIGVVTTVLETFGSTKLSQIANTYFVSPVGGSSGPQIRFNGAMVTVGQFGSWVPFAAEQITGGYEIAWKIAGADQYSVWNTDGNGNMLTNPTGVVSGSSYALQSLESSFQQDVNGDGTTGTITTVLESFGSTKLSQVANTYFVSPVGGSSGPQIRFNGAAMTVGQFGSWVPFAAEQITGGYEIAWKIAGTDQYSVWNTDGNGNMLSNPTGIVSGSSYALQSLEPSFQQDLNGDAVVGAVTTVLETFGSAKLSQVADTYFVSPVGGSSGPQIKFNGAAVTVGQFGSWVPFAAEQLSGGGYEVAWKIAGADQYSVWNTDGNGNMLSNPTGVVSGSSPALKALEPGFQQDLNGDGTIGPASSASGYSASVYMATSNMATDGSATIVGLFANYIASTFVTPAGQSTGVIVSASSSEPEFLAKPLA